MDLMANSHQWCWEQRWNWGHDESSFCYKVHYPQVTIAPDIASEETKGSGKKKEKETPSRL